MMVTTLFSKYLWCVGGVLYVSDVSVMEPDLQQLKVHRDPLHWLEKQSVERGACRLVPVDVTLEHQTVNQRRDRQLVHTEVM